VKGARSKNAADSLDHYTIIVDNLARIQAESTRSGISFEYDYPYFEKKNFNYLIL
jgi:hypothetical protein